MKKILKTFLWIPMFISMVHANSQFCGARLSREDQNKLYHLALTALEEVFQEMKATEALQTVETLKHRKPQRLHVVGTQLKKARGKIHMSLCYKDGSSYLKCSDVYKQIGSDKKLADIYDHLISQPIKIKGAGIYGKFVGLEVDPKQLMHEDKPVTSDLHISLIKVRENPDLQHKLVEKLQSKIKDIGPFTLEKSSCRVERKEAEYVKMKHIKEVAQGEVQPVR